MKTEEVLKKIETGVLLEDTKTNTRYRVDYSDDTFVRLVKITYGKLIFETITMQELVLRIVRNDIRIIEEPDDPIVVTENLPEATKEKYLNRLAVMNDLRKLLGNDWSILATKTAKPEIYSIFKKYNVPRRTINRWIVRYIQSGYKNSSLVKGNLKGFSEKKKKYSYSTKPGRKSTIRKGKIIDEYDIQAFEHAFKIYKEKSYEIRTLAGAWGLTKYEYYNVRAITGTGSSKELVPPDQRPTLDQFRYYVKLKTTPKERIALKIGAREFNNNKRLLILTS